MATKIMPFLGRFMSKIEQEDVEFDSQGPISVAENAPKNDHMVCARFWNLEIAHHAVVGR